MVTEPTAPVAPTTPMRASDTRSLQLERLVQRLDGLRHVLGADVAGDLDRRGRDDLRPDARALERGERPRSDPGVALHAGADERDLPEVVAHRPLDIQSAQRALGRHPVL